jgi:hypothetical protein
MRRPDTSKQRVWLGPGQYRGGRRNAASNPNSGSYPTNNGDSVRAYSDSNTKCDSYGNSNYDAYTECNSDSDTHGNSDDLAYCYAQGDTKGSADTASQANSVVSID